MKTYKFRINGNEYNVEINSVEGNLADVTVNGAAYKVEMENAPAAPAAPAATANPAAQARQDAPAVAPAKPAPAPAGAGKAITSPLPPEPVKLSHHPSLELSSRSQSKKARLSRLVRKSPLSRL